MRFLACVVMLVSGCAAARSVGPRYVVEASILAMPPTVSGEVAERLRRAEGPVLRCFDAMAERRELQAPPQQQVSLEVVVRGGQPLLMQVRARGKDTITDPVLTSCLSEIVDGWQWPSGGELASDADVVIPVSVQPRAGRLSANWAGPSWTPRQRAGE